MLKFASFWTPLNYELKESGVFPHLLARMGIKRATNSIRSFLRTEFNLTEFLVSICVETVTHIVLLVDLKAVKRISVHIAINNV